MNRDAPTNLPGLASLTLAPYASGLTPVGVSEPVILPPLRQIFSVAELVPEVLKTQAPTPHEPLDISSRNLPVPRGFKFTGERPEAFLSTRSTEKLSLSPRKQVSIKRQAVPNQDTASKKICRKYGEDETSVKKVHASRRARLYADIDLSLDENKDIKPFFSPAKLAAQSILVSDRGELSLEGILQWIRTHYAFVRHEPRKSVRWIHRVPAEMRRMTWLFEQVPGPVHTVWRIRDECRVPLLREAFKQGRMPPYPKLLEKEAALTTVAT